MDITELVAQRLASLGMDPQMAYGPNVAMPASVANALAPAPAPAPAPANAMAAAPAPAAAPAAAPFNRSSAINQMAYYRSNDPIFAQMGVSPQMYAVDDSWAQILAAEGFPNIMQQVSPGGPDEPAQYALTPAARAEIERLKGTGLDVAVRFTGGDLNNPRYALVGANNEVLKEFTQPNQLKAALGPLASMLAVYFGAPYFLGGSGAAGAAGAAGIAEGMVPGGLAAAGIPATAAELGAVGALTGAGAGGIGPGIAEGMAPGGLASAGVPPTSAETAAVGALTGTGRGLGAGIPSAIGQAVGGAASGLGKSVGDLLGQAAGGAAKGLADSSIWGPLISSLASLYGGEKTAEATKEAARLQAEAANRAIGLQETMYREGVARQAPFLQEGTAAFNRLAALQRGGPEAAQQFLTTEPGYGFRLGEGLKALERTQAARGNLLSGGAIKAGQRYAQDVASQEYQNAYNRLAQMAGIGPQAAGVANTLGQTYASNVGNLATQQGAASANALLGGAAARQSAYGDIGEAWGRYFAPQPTINYLGGGGYGR